MSVFESLPANCEITFHITDGVTWGDLRGLLALADEIGVPNTSEIFWDRDDNCDITGIRIGSRDTCHGDLEVGQICGECGALNPGGL